MESIINTITSALGNIFGNSSTGPRWAGILTTLAGGAAGYFSGAGWLGVGVGVLAGGVVGGIVNQSFFPQDASSGVNPNGGKPPVVAGPAQDPRTIVQPPVVVTPPARTADTTPSGARVPLRQDPGLQPGLSANPTLTDANNPFKLSIPRPDALKRPWEEGKRHEFVESMEKDTIRILTNPVAKDQSLDILIKAANARNESFYKFLKSTAQHHQNFLDYEQKIRPAMMKRLGITEQDASIKPPRYTKPLQFSRKPSADMLLHARVYLNITEDDWNKMDAITHMTHVEDVINKRMAENAAKLNKLGLDAEALDRAVPFDFNFSWANVSNNLNALTFEVFGKTASTKFKEALESYLSGKISEAKFRAESETIITEHISGGQFSGADQAAKMRDLVSVVIERMQVNAELQEMMFVKDSWAQDADLWLADAQEFHTRIHRYAASYVEGEGLTDKFTLVGEEPLVIVSKPKVPYALQQLEDERTERNSMRESAKGDLNLMLLKLNARYFSMLQPIDMEKDFAGLPTTADIQFPLSGARAARTSNDPEMKEVIETIERWKKERTEQNPDPVRDAALRLSAALGVPVTLAYKKDANGRAVLKIAAGNAEDAKALMQKLQALRTELGFTADNFAVSGESGEVHLFAANFVAYNGKQPTALNEEALKKVEAVAAKFKAATKETVKDHGLMEPLRRAVKSYNDALTDYKAKWDIYEKSNGENGKDEMIKARAKLGVDCKSCIEAVHQYAKSYAQINNQEADSGDKKIRELSAQANSDTPLGGGVGFSLTVIDKRDGKNRKIKLQGVKKNGEYLVTGWEWPDGALSDGLSIGYFGSDLADIGKGMKLDTKTLQGVEAIMTKIAESEAARKQPPENSMGALPADVREKALASVTYDAAAFSRPANENTVPLFLQGGFGLPGMQQHAV